MTNYFQMWVEVKKLEREAKERRYELEEKIANNLNYDGSTGKSESFDVGDYDVNFIGRTSWKVDYDTLRDIVLAYNIPRHEVERLFRFKAEVNVAEWKLSGDNLTAILKPAVTKTVGRSSLKIETKE